MADSSEEHRAVEGTEPDDLEPDDEADDEAKLVDDDDEMRILVTAAPTLNPC